MGDRARMSPCGAAETAVDRVARHFTDGQQGALQQPLKCCVCLTPHAMEG